MALANRDLADPLLKSADYLADTSIKEGAANGSMLSLTQQQEGSLEGGKYSNEKSFKARVSVQKNVEANPSDFATQQ